MNHREYRIVKADHLGTFICSGVGFVFYIRNGGFEMKRALISVSDKTGIIEFAKELSSLGWEIISTGGTHKALENAGVALSKTPRANIEIDTGMGRCGFSTDKLD